MVSSPCGLQRRRVLLAGDERRGGDPGRARARPSRRRIRIRPRRGWLERSSRHQPCSQGRRCAQGVVVVSVCMRMHRHTYTPIHACMYAYDGTANAVHRHTYTHAYMHTCMHTHMHAYIRLYSECGSPPYIHTCIHTHMHTYTHACIHTIVQRMRLTECRRSPHDGALFTPTAVFTPTTLFHTHGTLSHACLFTLGSTLLHTV